MALDPAWIALIGTVMGGVGLKVTEHWLGRSKIKIDDAAQLRGELRQEITAQREEIKQLETERDKWREEYYALLQKYMAQTTELTLAVQRVKGEIDEAEGRILDINKQPPPTPTPPPLDKLDETE